MKRIIRLTESDLTRIVKRVIKESEELTAPNLNPTNENKEYFERVYIGIKNANSVDKKKTDRFDSVIYKVMESLKKGDPNWAKNNDILVSIIQSVALGNLIPEKYWGYFGRLLNKNKKSTDEYMDLLSTESRNSQLG